MPDNQKPHLIDIEKLIGEIPERFKNTKYLDGMQNDPASKTTTNFKQEYTVIIRKKKFYAATAGSNNNHKYTDIYQLNNFTSIRTNISSTGQMGTCSINLVGNTRVIHATRNDQDEKQWGSNDDGFYNMLNNWAANIEDNSEELNADGNILYKDILFTDINKLKEKKYGWKIAEKCDFQPMDEIYVFAKSRKVKEKNGRYKMFQVFFGYISTVNKTYSAGEGEPLITIQADDHTKLLQLSYLNNNPGMDYRSELAAANYNIDFAGNLIIDDGVANGGIVNMYTNVFAGRYPYEIILKCAKDAGISDRYLEKRIEKITKIPFMQELNNNAAKEVYQSDLKDRLGYCKTAAEKIFIEFFADEEGNIVLKIPNWTLGINKQLANNMYLELSPEDTEKMKTVGKQEEKIVEKTTVYETVTKTLTETITHKVVKGDTLYNLAKKYLGDSNKWPEIHKLNSNVKNPHLIYPGQVLYIKKGQVTTQKVPKEQIIEKTKVTEGNKLTDITDKYIRVIEDDEIIGFSLSDSDKQVINAFEVQQEVPLVNAAMQKIPQSSKRAIQDWRSIGQFGFRFGKNHSTPLLDQEVGPELFGALMVQKSMAERYKGTLKMIEESSIRVGDPIRIFLYDEHPFGFDYNKNGTFKERAQAIFYVTSIERSIDVAGVSTMTLSLNAGRVIGMESIYDNMYVLYKKYYEEPKIVDVEVEGNSESNASSGPNTTQEQVVRFAKEFLNVPYVWGGKDPKTGFDCSGFVSYVFKHFGINIPAYTKTMKDYGTSVNLGSLEIADMIFFNDYGHVGIYIGNNQFIHASGSQTKQGGIYKVKITSLAEYSKVHAARRLVKQNVVTGYFNRTGNISIDGKNCIDVITDAIITSYNDVGPTAGGVHADASGKIAAAHGIPVGTKIYIPTLKHVNGTGIFDVQDTGGPFFDFDINTTKNLGKSKHTVYILSWGNGKKLQTFSQAIEEQKRLGQWNGPKANYSTAYYNYSGQFKTENIRF